MYKIIFTIFLTASFVTQSFSQFYIFGNTNQTNISRSSFNVNFTTNIAGQTLLRYGTSPTLELGYISNGQNTTNHDIILGSLEPASFYYVRPCVTNGTDTFQSTKTFYFSTASNSSGDIKIFFNRSIDNSVSNGTFPNISNSPAAIQAELIKRIDSAKTSIDCAVYNNNTNAITTALNNAYNRGVKVRYIADDGTTNTALSTANFPVLYVNNMDLMHHKFMIVDVDSVNSSYVWTGSMNWTSNNINTDFNNVVLVQDQALARAYKIEFEEMWGSNSMLPNPTNSKYGSLKTDNTPHLFNINGKLVECYFSPSDKTSLQIERALNSADVDIEFAIFSFTYNSFGTAITNKYQSGKTIAGMIENIGDVGTEYTAFVNAGMDVLAHSVTHDLHHKYAIVDANTLSSDPTVITGSHNWSVSAETVNDENTLIIHDANISNWFLQEFSKRYCEVKATVNCQFNPPISVDQTEILTKAKVYPNPANQYLFIDQLPESASIRIVNELGQLIYSQENVNNGFTEINLNSWTNGSYFIQIQNNQIIQLEKLIIIK